MKTMIHIINGHKNDNASMRPKKIDHIHTSLLFLIRFGNVFGLIPVSGLSSIYDLHFNWKSFKCIYTYFAIAIFLIDSILCVLDWIRDHTPFTVFVSQIYHINALIILLLHLSLASKWPKFLKKWFQVDNLMQVTYGYPKKFRIRIKIATICFMSAGEAIFFFSLNIIDIYTQNSKFGFDLLTNKTNPEITNTFSSNFLTTIFLLYVSLVETVIWTYNDLLIVVLSMGVALRFKQITNRLSSQVKNNNSLDFWIEIRSDYNRIVKLAKKLDKKLSYIVLLSFSFNILLLLVKISSVIGELKYKLQIAYHIYSFIFLIVRLTLVSLYAAWVNDESKGPLRLLNSVPSSCYNTEIRRFILQISFNDVALTGSKLFRVTRGLILSIAGAIVTYELVVIQFRSSLSS